MVPQGAPRVNRRDELIDLDAQQPHSREAERAVLGAMLIDGAALAKALPSRLTPADFYELEHALIFGALLDLAESGKPWDVTILTNELDRTGKLVDVGGAAKLTELVMNCPMAMRAEAYAEIVIECADLRKLQREMLERWRDAMQIDAGAMAAATRDEIVRKLQDLDLDRTSRLEPATWQDLDGLIGPVEWAWPAWLPRAFLTLLAGEAGVGKSILALRLAATFLGVTDLWPDAARFDGEPGTVLWCEAEAAQPLNLERAKTWGLPLDRLIFPFGEPTRDVQLDDPQHRAAINAAIHRPDVRFCVVDSLSGASGRDENSSETLETVHWLAMLARDSGRPILVTHHLRKRSLFDGDDQKVSLARLRGYSGIVQPARLVLALDAPDPNAEDTKRLSVIKSNLARFPEPLGLQVTEAGVIFCDAPEAPKRYSALDEAKDAIQSILDAGPKLASDVQDELEARGISTATASRAKRDLGVVSRKEGKTWFWGLPTDDALPPSLLE